MAREFWLIENNPCIQAFVEKPQMHPNWTLPVIHVREVVDGESPTQPTELEMHRADHQSVKAAGFECVGELLAAYNVLLAKRDVDPVAWMAFGACTAAPIFSDTPPDDVNLAGWEPLYRHPQPDHAKALADALDRMIKLDEGNCQRYPGDEDVCMEVRLARESLAAYRASQKGGNHD